LDTKASTKHSFYLKTGLTGSSANQIKGE